MGIKIPKELFVESGLTKHDSDHEVVRELRDGAKLHRFTVAGEIEYSAIYEGSFEVCSCLRTDEDEMIKFYEKYQEWV